MSKIGAVLLAAGAGRRLGSIAKALIRIEGVSLAQRHLRALRAAGVGEIVMVSGFDHHAVEAEARALAPCGMVPKLAYNAGFAQGLTGSVRLGLAALGPGFDGILMSLVDQPLIEGVDLTALIDAFENRPGGDALVPHVDGARGNPVMIDEVVRARVLAGAADLGVRDLLEREPALMHAWQTGNARFVTDLDTPEDVARLAALTGWRIELPPVRTA